MGDKTNIQDARVRPSQRRFGVARALALVGLLAALAIDAGANEPAGSDATDAPVSTSPAPPAAPGPATRWPTTSRIDTPPLTRAAERQRVEQISPVSWLSRFGEVRVERND